MSQPLVLSEDLLIKPRKNIAQINFLSKMESTSAIFLFAQENLMKSQNPKAIEFYLDTIAKKLNQITYNHFEINMVDFYITTFCVSTTELFSNSLYNTPKCKKLISRIQVLLTYLFIYDEMVTFFDLENTQYLFAWEKEYTLNYLEELNDSMNLSYSLVYRDLNTFESTLTANKAEENIVAYLFQQFENDQSDIRPIMILLNSFKWMNDNIILDQLPIQLIQDILKNNNNPKPMVEYFVNIMERIISNEKKYLTEHMNDTVNSLITDVFNKDYFQFLLDFIKDLSDSDSKFSLAYFIYSKLAKDYLIVYQDSEIIKDIVFILIEYIEFASCCRGFNLNGLHIFIKNRYDSLGEPNKLVKAKIQEVIKSDHLLMPKLYGYFSLAFRSMEQHIRSIFFQFPFKSSDDILESSLDAIRKCIKYLNPDNSLFILSNFSYIFDNRRVIPTMNSAIYFIDCACEFMYNCNDKALCKFCKGIFLTIAEKVVDMRSPEEDELLVSLSKLFDHPNFPVMIYLTDKNLYIEFFSRLLDGIAPPFIETAKHLIQAINKSRNCEDVISKIYNNILEFVKSQTINILNMLEMAHIFSMLPKDFIVSSDDAKAIIQIFLSLDQKTLCSSKYYIQFIVQALEFESFDIVQLHVAIESMPETILLIAKLPSDQVHPTQEETMQKAIGFAEIILNNIQKYSQDLNEELSDIYEVIINQTIHYIMPIFPFIGEVNTLTFIKEVITAINKFILKPAELNIFFSFFELCDFREYQSIAWAIFSDLKDIFMVGRGDCDLSDFDDQALEILKFQHYMFSIDSVTANGILSQITPKNREYSNFSQFMNNYCKKPYNDTIFRNFVEILKRRCKSIRHI